MKFLIESKTCVTESDPHAEAFGGSKLVQYQVGVDPSRAQIREERPRTPNEGKVRQDRWRLPNRLERVD